MEAPRVYSIDVCKTCGKRAVWPFCEHRDQNGPWTMTLAVTPTKAGRSKLQAEMDRRKSDAA